MSFKNRVSYYGNIERNYYTNNIRKTEIDWKIAIRHIKNYISHGFKSNHNIWSIDIRHKPLELLESKSEQKELSPKNKQIDVDIPTCWLIISKIVIYEPDDGVMNKHTIKLKLLHEFNYIKQALDNIIIPQLNAVLRENQLSVEFTNYDTHYKNIIAHIFLKGENFYNSILMNPNICIFLVDNYYPIYDWINQRIADF